MLAQVVAVIIFIAMFLFIVTEIVERHVVSLVCALLTVLFGGCKKFCVYG